MTRFSTFEQQSLTNQQRIISLLEQLVKLQKQEQIREEPEEEEVDMFKNVRAGYPIAELREG